MLAACVTAANLGSRITGWGFVIFTFGSIAWALYGLATGQPNLLWQNLALTVVNLIGVWRWLGRRARFDDGASAAARKSKRRPGPTMFPVSMLGGAAVTGSDGESLGTSVDAMAICEDGRIAYLVVGRGGVGGVGETLHLLPWERVSADPSGLSADLPAAAAAELPVVKPDDWPGAVPRP